MEEEILQRILQELQSQSGTGWLDVLQFTIPALAGLTGGLVAAWIGYQAAKRSYESQIETARLGREAELKKISLERRLEWRRERYVDLQNALAEFIAALDFMLEAQLRYAVAVFEKTGNEGRYLATSATCRDRFEDIRSSGRLSEARLKIGDEEIGEMVVTLSVDAEIQHLAMIRFAIDAVADFQKSGTAPGSEEGLWPEEHRKQRTNIDERTHQVSRLIEERISLTD